MALKMIEGFDTYASAAGAAIGEQLARWHNVSDTADSYRTVTGRYAGFGMRLATSATNHILYLTPPDYSPHNTWAVGFAIFQPSGGYATLGPFFRLSQVGTVGVTYSVGIESTTSNGFVVTDGSGATYMTTANNVITPGTWAYLELKAVCDSVSGSLELRIDGATVASISATDTDYNGTEAKWSKGMLSSAGDVTYSTYYDDLYICDGSGSDNNDFLGESRVTTLVPTSDDGPNDGTPSTPGDHYVLIDENPMNEADYITLTGNGDREEYGYSNTTNSNTVVGLQLGTMVNEQTASGAKIKGVIKSGASEVSATVREVIGGGYTMGSAQISETNPDTGNAWTVSEVDNGVFGYELET